MFDDLRQASYQNIVFHVSASEFNFGRRTVLHEFPQRDKPFIEDLGKATRKFTFTAFIVGSDYVTRAKRFVEVLETNPGETGGDLVHPWLGRLKVFPVDTPVIQWNIAKRIATLTLNFVEAGELLYPKIVTSWVNSLFESANNLYKDILGDYDPESITEYVTEVAEIANGALGTLSDTNFIKLLGMGPTVNNFSVEMASLLLDKDKLKDRIITDLGIASLAASSRDWKSISSSSASARDKMISTVAAVTSLTAYSSTKTSSITNASASIEKAFRLTMLGNAVASTAYIGTDYDQNLEGTQVAPFAEDVLRIRDDLLNSLDNEMLLGGIDDDDTYSTLADARYSVYNHLSELASDLGSVEEIKIDESTSSLALAYDRYGDASRDLEIVQRNNIANPLFLPTETLKVSSK